MSSSLSSNRKASQILDDEKMRSSCNENNMSCKKKPTAFIINFDDDGCISTTQHTTGKPTSNMVKTYASASQSLQEAFKKYRDDKIEGIKLSELFRQQRKSFRSCPERMWNLRLKFVEQAKKYLGVPYAKKNFAPNTPEYKSDLFLDCCGLVRKGNQAYMFDTLPKAIDRIEDVKPVKTQPHNITHVEILLGEGESTIGARWNNGKIQIFDSYKFISKSYNIDKYFFKSIDPWLLGYCNSYCQKHQWKHCVSRPLKRSIFSPYSQANLETTGTSATNKPRKSMLACQRQIKSSTASVTKVSISKKHKRKHRIKRPKVNRYLSMLKRPKTTNFDAQTTKVNSHHQLKSSSGLLRRSQNLNTNNSQQINFLKRFKSNVLNANLKSSSCTSSSSSIGSVSRSSLLSSSLSGSQSLTKSVNINKLEEISNDNVETTTIYEIILDTKFQKMKV